MANKNPTTVHLTPIAEGILEKEAPLLGGIKPILSAGLVLLEKLTGDEQKMKSTLNKIKNARRRLKPGASAKMKFSSDK